MPMNFLFLERIPGGRGSLIAEGSVLVDRDHAVVEDLPEERSSVELLEV